jgi:multidrug efflux pump subunit AcrA (membrane-fusion protein)
MSVASTSKPDTLDALQIARRPERKSRIGSTLRLVLVNPLIITVLAAAAYALYLRAANRPLEVETFVVTSAQGQQPGILLTGSGYVVTQHKYIIVGTKILGQIVEEPIEEGQRVKKGAILARIDDRDYRAQLQQAIADRDVAAANVHLWLAKAGRQRELYASGVISKDDLDTSENALAVAQATSKRDEAAIDYAKFEVSQCLIVSPIAGVVLQNIGKWATRSTTAGRFRQVVGLPTSSNWPTPATCGPRLTSMNQTSRNFFSELLLWSYRTLIQRLASMQGSSRFIPKQTGRKQP